MYQLLGVAISEPELSAPPPADCIHVLYSPRVLTMESLTINKKYAAQYEKKKRAEELSRRELLTDDCGRIAGCPFCSEGEVWRRGHW